MTNKLLLLAVAAGTLTFASCQNEAGDGMSDEMMQAKVDSAVQARMGEMQAQLAASNDSLINAMAMMKADSMMAAAASAGNNNTGVRRTVPTRPATTPKTTATANDGRLNVKGSSNNDGRLDVNKTSEDGKNKSGNDGRLKID